MIIGHYMRGMFDQGGVATYIRSLVAAQVESGHVVELFDGIERDNDRALAHALSQTPVDVLHVHCSWPLLSLPKASVRTVHAHEPSCPSGSRYLSRQQVPCDRIAGLLPCLRGHVLDACGSRRPTVALEGIKRYSKEQHQLREAQLLTNSEFLRQRLVLDGFSAKHVLHLPFPRSSCADEMLPRDSDTFTFAGRLTRNKGLLWLLRSLVALPSARLIVLGQGPEEGPARRLVMQLGLVDRVVFAGWCDREAVQMHMRRSRAVIVPSLWPEPLGMVALEAMSVGTPVVASNSGGLSELVQHGVNGFLVKTGDVEALSGLLRKMLNMSEGGFARMSLAASTFALTRPTAAGHAAALVPIYEKAAMRS